MLEFQVANKASYRRESSGEPLWGCDTVFFVCRASLFVQRRQRLRRGLCFAFRGGSGVALFFLNAGLKTSQIDNIIYIYIA